MNLTNDQASYLAGYMETDWVEVHPATVTIRYRTWDKDIAETLADTLSEPMEEHEDGTYSVSVSGRKAAELGADTSWKMSNKTKKKSLDDLHKIWSETK